MTCTCKTPNQSCPNALPRVIGYYCSLELEPTRPELLGNLKSGNKFSHPEATWLVHTVFANYGDRIVYQREDGWKITTTDLDRVVNLVVKEL